MLIAGALLWRFPYRHTYWEGFRPQDYPEIDGATYFMLIQPIGGTLKPINITGPWRCHLVVVGPTNTFEQLVLKRVAVGAGKDGEQLLGPEPFVTRFVKCTNAYPPARPAHAPEGYVQAVAYLERPISFQYDRKARLLVDMDWEIVQAGHTNSYSRQFTFNAFCIDWSGFCSRSGDRMSEEKLNDAFRGIRDDASDTPGHTP
mgnify:CR=1 FL=1